MNADCMIDLGHLEKYVAGDDALRDEILSVFSSQAIMLNGQFTVELSDHDWSNTAHALKGAARGVGAWALGDLCERAEQLVGNLPGKPERRAALLISLRRRLADTIAGVEQLQADGVKEAAQA